MLDDPEFLKRHEVTPNAPSQWVPGVSRSLGEPRDRRHFTLGTGKWRFDACLDATSFCIVCATDRGTQIALRLCFDPQGIHSFAMGKANETSITFRVEAPCGRYEVAVG